MVVGVMAVYVMAIKTFDLYRWCDKIVCGIPTTTKVKFVSHNFSAMRCDYRLLDEVGS